MSDNVSPYLELPESWVSKLPEDLRPLVIAKGWRTPAEAIKSYAHLERLVGQDKVALPPKNAMGARDWSRWDGWTIDGLSQVRERADLAREAVFALQQAVMRLQQIAKIVGREGVGVVSFEACLAHGRFVLTRARALGLGE